ncbi:Docking protein 2 [Lamellibrachia satsuma]|nr:Docking protein 2 [Lamellibrachia satsuma]
MEKGIKQGNLHMLVSRPGNVQKLQKRFYALHGYTSTVTARLDCYASEMSFLNNQPALSTYCFDDVAEIRYRETPGQSSGQKHCFEIVCKQQRLLFSAPTSGEIQEWVMALMALKFESEQRKDRSRNVIYEPLDIASRLTAIVKIEETDSSKRCQLGDAEYRLHVCPSDIILIDPGSKQIRQQWLYRDIRCYTCSQTVFSFEAGRRCASGEGLFSFKTPVAAKLSAEVQDAVRTLQNTDPGHYSTSTLAEELHAPMNKQSPVYEQENAESTTYAKSTTTPAAQTGSYENITELARTPTEPQSHPEYIFLVQLEETEASKRCKLARAEYQLNFDTSSISLRDPTSKTIIQHWPFSVIRRYMSTSKWIMFEAGRHAASSEGYFKFTTSMPRAISQAWKLMTSRCRSQLLASSSVNMRTPAGHQRVTRQTTDAQHVSDYETPSTSSLEQQGVTYASLDRTSASRHNVRL